MIIGGSYIGLEFGQMYRRFGARVTVIEKAPHVIAREDSDVIEAVTTILRDDGVTIETGAECMQVEKRGKQVAVKLDCAGSAREVKAHICCWRSAACRTPVIWGSTKRARKSTRAATSPSTTSSTPACRRVGDRRLQRPRRVHAYVV